MFVPFLVPSTRPASRSCLRWWLAGAPFLKVEATKFTEVGYVGRDVEQIVRDLVEIGIGLVKDAKKKEIEARAHLLAEERLLDTLLGERPSRVQELGKIIKVPPLILFDLVG